MRQAIAVTVLAGLIGLAGCDANKQVWQLTPEGVQMRAAKVELPGVVWVGEAHACPPALAVGPKGEAVVTSNVLPTLWRVDAKTLAVTVHPLQLDADLDKDVGFTSIAYSPAHAAYYAVSGNHGSVWKIDASLSRAEKVATKTTLCSPGG